MAWQTRAKLRLGLLAHWIQWRNENAASSTEKEMLAFLVASIKQQADFLNYQQPKGKMSIKHALQWLQTHERQRFAKQALKEYVDRDNL